jgi:hypothetical protein
MDRFWPVGTLCEYCFTVPAKGALGGRLFYPICYLCDDRALRLGPRTVGIQRVEALGALWAATLARNPMPSLPVAIDIPAIRTRIYFCLWTIGDDRRVAHTHHRWWRFAWEMVIGYDDDSEDDDGIVINEVTMTVARH